VTTVLIVDDEPQILRALRINLQARQYDVVTAGTGAEALSAAENKRPDVVVLDLGLPDMDGVQIVRALRAWTSVPIIILSGRLDSRAKVQALDAGADDYVTKPFSVEELLARVRAVSRRLNPATPQEPVRIGRYVVDLADHTITSADARPQADAVPARGAPGGRAPADQADVVHLTPTEWHLLEMLVRNPGRLVSQRQLLQEVWGPTYLTETHYLRQYMKHLRRKLEPEPSRPRHLLTEPGMGYRFQP
jgi:two-component system KDP operon response regulator KdpE